MLHPVYSLSYDIIYEFPEIRYDTINYVRLIADIVNLIYHTEPKTKKVENKKNKMKIDIPRNRLYVNSPGSFVESEEEEQEEEQEEGYGWIDLWKR